MPCSSSAIEISLEIMPTIDTGMAYGVTRFQPSLKNSKYCFSATSIPPAPLPTRTPAPGSFGAQPRVLPRFARGNDGDERCLRVAAGIGASGSSAPSTATRGSNSTASSIVSAGTGAATMHGYREASKSVIARVPLQPRRNVLPEALAPDAERRHYADPGDCHARNASTHPPIIAAGTRFSGDARASMEHPHGVARPASTTRSPPTRRRRWSRGPVAAVFVFSLAVLPLFVLWRFGVPAGDGGAIRPVALNVLLFSAFAAHHSVFARTGVEGVGVGVTFPRRSSDRYTRGPASVLFIARLPSWQPVPGMLYQWDSPWRRWPTRFSSAASC